jgi:hypothetical protein
MSFEPEKRRFPRHDHSAPLTYCHFQASAHDSSDHYPGELLGHGAGGLRFKSRSAVRPGTMLLIKLNCGSGSSPGPDAWEGFRTVTLAEVMWCQPASEEEGAEFLVGAKYFNPYF